MKISKYSEAQPKIIDNDIAKGITARVVMGKEDGSDNFCMRIFKLSKDGYTPRHSHDWEHGIFIFSGKGAIFNKGKWVIVEPGYSVFIPGNEDHQIKNINDEPLIFTCTIPSGPPEL